VVATIPALPPAKESHGDILGWSLPNENSVSVRFQWWSDRPNLSDFDWRQIGDLTVTAYDAAIRARNDKSGSRGVRRIR
jgi:hypothetical protein